MESSAKALSMFLLAYYAFIFPLLLIFHFRSFQFLSFVITLRDPEDIEFGEKKLGRDTNTVWSWLFVKSGKLNPSQQRVKWCLQEAQRLETKKMLVKTHKTSALRTQKISLQHGHCYNNGLQAYLKITEYILCSYHKKTACKVIC